MEKTLNLVEQMPNVVVSPADTTPSMKKTAVSFLSGFINHGFDAYIKENMVYRIDEIREIIIPIAIRIKRKGKTGKDSIVCSSLIKVVKHMRRIILCMQREAV